MNLVPASKFQLKEIRKLYKSAFPANERKPFWMIEKHSNKGNMDILTLEDNGFFGFLTVVKKDNLALISYFAIAESARGKGAGSEAIKLISERYQGKKVFLEIEQPDETASNNSERIRRKNFYLRNGFIDTNVRVNLFGVDMEILSTGSDLTFEEYHSVYSFIVGHSLARKVREIKN